MRTILVVLVSVVLLASTVTVKAQEATICLPAEVVRGILNERNGGTWDYAFYDKVVIESSSCVSRIGNALRYTDGREQRVIQWVGTKQYGHWYRIERVEKTTIQYEDRREAGLPPAPAVYADIFLTSRITLRVIKFTPAVQRIRVPWTVEYRLSLLEWSELTKTWSVKSIDYRPRPSRGPRGEIYDLHAYAPSAITKEQAQVLSNRFTPTVLDFIEDSFFDNLRAEVVK